MVHSPPDSGDGDTVGPYRLLELLGRGGMGEVWRAYDGRRERVVALKLLAARWADSEEFRERFRREATATARVDSAHVVLIHDFGEVEGRLFIDMRLVPGGDLAEALRRSPQGLEPWRAATVTAQVASGLDAAHRQGLLHRDVKPSNVLLESDRAGERAYLVDFGIAKSADETLAGALTAPGETLGTPAYMAPELYTGQARAGVAGDVYALGCVLFEMLTGRRPFDADTASGLMGQHLSWPAPLPSGVRPELAAFDPVVVRALAKDPALRHPNAGDLGDAAFVAARAMAAGRSPGPVPTTVLAGPGAEGPAGPEPARGRRRRNLLISAGAAVVVVAAVLAAVLLPARDDTPDGPAASDAPQFASPAAPAAAEQVAVTLTDPIGVTLSPDGTRAYVADSTDGAVVVLDTATRTVLTTVPAGRAPNLIAVSPDSKRVYVTDYGGDTVAVIDAITDTVVATVRVGPKPYAIAVSSNGRVYVGNSGSSERPGTTVSVIDPTSNAVVATVPVGTDPNRLAVSPDGTRVYVPIFGGVDAPGRTMTVIDTATNTTSTLATGDRFPVAVRIAPDGRRLYVICLGGLGSLGTVQVLDDGRARQLTAAGIDYPGDAAVSPDGRTLVVTNSGTDTAPARTVALIDTATGALRRSVTLAGRPSEVGMAPSGNQVWVTTSEPAGLWRIPLS